MIQHCAMHRWVRRWRSRTAGVGWTGVALVTALTAGNCASQLGRKTVPKPSPSGATTAMHPEEMREVRSCAELQQLDRPAIKGGNCIGLPGGGFVGLVAGSRTSKWLDAEGLGRSEYSDYQVWLYRPPVDRPGVSPASGTNEPPAALSWPDEVVCRNGEESGGGNWDSERCALVLAHDLDGDGRLDVLIERRSTSSSGGCCSTESKTTSYTFYTVESGALVENKRFPAIASSDASLSVADVDRDGHPDLLGTLDYAIPEKCGAPNLLLHSVPGVGLVRDDAVAKQVARAWCPKPPAGMPTALPPTELAKYVLCARLWGQTPAQVRASLGSRCRNTEPGSPIVSAEGKEQYPYPWHWCYRSGIECESPEIRDVCAPWLQDLIDAPPPFRF